MPILDAYIPPRLPKNVFVGYKHFTAIFVTSYETVRCKPGMGHRNLRLLRSLVASLLSLTRLRRIVFVTVSCPWLGKQHLRALTRLYMKIYLPVLYLLVYESQTVYSPQAESDVYELINLGGSLTSGAQLLVTLQNGQCGQWRYLPTYSPYLGGRPSGWT